MSGFKNIFIVRHGHAEFEAHRDFDRELKLKGVKAVKKTADFIQRKSKELDIITEICISSAAVRTKQTAEIICSINHLKTIEYHQHLYTTTISEWLDKILNSRLRNIIIVGHNPTFSQMLNNLCGYELYMKPANCALINLETKTDGIVYPATLNEFYDNE